MAATLIDQIDAELQSIRKKLAGPSDIGALLAVLTANIATTKTAIDTFYDVTDAGTGLGPLSDQQGGTAMTSLLVTAIAAEGG